jgi:16S rRNA (guanine(966)-N(2))-methyltransferase RsmD
MRLLSGTLKGLYLSYPNDQRFRPTQEKVREALFSMLQPYLENAMVLDLFCGTGGIGFEALSRGASQATFVDKDIQYVQTNLAYLDTQRPLENLREKTTVIKQDALTFLGYCKSMFTLIYIDPPWEAPHTYTSDKEPRGSNRMVYDDDEIQSFLDLASGVKNIEKHIRQPKHPKRAVHPKDLKRTQALYTDALMAISAFDILHPNGIVVCEHKKALPLSATNGLTLRSSHLYGGSCLTLFQKATL